MTRNQRKRAVASMKAFQAEVKRFGETGMVLRRNLLNGTVLWSNTSDTEWYRGDQPLPRGYVRLVATWPDEDEKLWEPGLTTGTLGVYGNEVFFVADEDGDRALTEKEQAAVLDILQQTGAKPVEDVLAEQRPLIETLAEQGLLTTEEMNTASQLNLL